MPLAMIAQAMQAHRRDPERGRWWPKPADLLSRCRDAQQVHPATDAAWALALESLDEAASVVWTDPIAQARAAALPVWLAGDKVGARMAFKSAYEQVLAMAQEPPRWRFSPGHDPQRREQAAERALQQGLLPPQAVARCLPAPALAPEMQAVAGLLTGHGVEHPATESAHTRARLREMQQALASAVKVKEDARAMRLRAREAAAQARHARRHGMRVLDLSIERRGAEAAAWPNKHNTDAKHDRSFNVELKSRDPVANWQSSRGLKRLG